MLPFRTTWMDPEGIMLSEVSQTEEKKKKKKGRKVKLIETEEKRGCLRRG